jgi:hypothetical protein
MRKRLLKIMAIICLSWQLAVCPCGQGWSEDNQGWSEDNQGWIEDNSEGKSKGQVAAGVVGTIILSPVIITYAASQLVVGVLISPAEMNKWGPECIPDWRGRQIEELYTYWPTEIEIGWCPSSLVAFGSQGQDYKGDEVKVYKWHVYRVRGFTRYCGVWFVVNEKGKIIDQILEGNCVAGTCLKETEYPPPKNASAEEKNISAGGAGLPKFGPGKKPVTCKWQKYEYGLRYKLPAGLEYEARFPDKDKQPGAYEAVVKSWKGRRMDDLIRAWGKPTRSYVKSKKGWIYFPDEVVTVNQWVIMDNSRPPEPKGKNYRWRASLMCDTSFGADSKGTIISEELFYNSYMCELMMADKLWSPRKAPGKP